jgi:SNF family Na+-dependent transporter
MWSSRLGVILAVAGSAIGLGNFLRFPGLAAQYGSGAFMLAYFISLALLGIPIGWAEWTLGRYAGQRGFRSSPGIFHVLIPHPAGKYIGAVGVVIPIVIYMYYIWIEAWCLGYTWYFLTGHLKLGDNVEAYAKFWDWFVGASRNGFSFGNGGNPAFVFLFLVFALNFYIIYRGLAKGIEWFCKAAIPTLIVLGLIVLVRVLTLGTPDPLKPEQNIVDGLGYMWNPQKAVLEEQVEKSPGDTHWREVQDLFGEKNIQARQAELANNPRLRVRIKTVWEQLLNPQLWLVAAGQIFFSLGVGFGIIATYASYLRKQDDVVLSSLSASAANEFCEVGLGGLITVPAAYVFLAAAGIIGQGTFGLGFKVLPLVFAKMPWPAFFGSIWFFLLFLAAITSSLSMLQPGIAFLEEALDLNRKQSISVLGLVTALGCGFVVCFSKNVKALDTLDFWAGTFLIFVMAAVLIVVFGWVVGIEKGWDEAHRGAEIRIPNVFRFLMRYVSPLYLLAIFVLWTLFNVLGWNPKAGDLKPTSYITDLIGSRDAPPSGVAQWSVIVILICFGLTLWVVRIGGKRWAKLQRTEKGEAYDDRRMD